MLCPVCTCLRFLTEGKELDGRQTFAVSAHVHSRCDLSLRDRVPVVWAAQGHLFTGGFASAGAL